jgi:hypothetical protein
MAFGLFDARKELKSKEKKLIENEEKYRLLSGRVLVLLNRPDNLYDIIRSVLELISETHDCDAAGVRLRDGNDSQ